MTFFFTLGQIHHHHEDGRHSNPAPKQRPVEMQPHGQTTGNNTHAQPGSGRPNEPGFVTQPAAV
jgi:hypothetical protein